MEQGTRRPARPVQSAASAGVPTPRQAQQRESILDEYASMSAEISELLAEVEGPHTTLDKPVAACTTPDRPTGQHAVPQANKLQGQNTQVYTGAQQQSNLPQRSSEIQRLQESLAPQARKGDGGGSNDEYDAEDENGEGEELTAQEIADYARGTLGIDPVWDAELLWIAVEGLRAPLPDGWVEVCVLAPLCCNPLLTVVSPRSTMTKLRTQRISTKRRLAPPHGSTRWMGTIAIWHRCVGAGNNICTPSPCTVADQRHRRKRRKRADFNATQC